MARKRAKYVYRVSVEYRAGDEYYHITVFVHSIGLGAVPDILQKAKDLAKSTLVISRMMGREQEYPAAEEWLGATIEAIMRV